MQSREALGLILGLIAVVVFGATLPMTRLAVGDLGPWFLTLARASGAGLIAVTVLLSLRRKPPRRQFGQLFLAAVLLVGGFPGLTGVAMQSVPAAHGGIVVGVLPLATIVAAALIDGERPSAGFWGCGIAGAALVVAFAVRHGTGPVAAGDLLLILAVACAAAGYTISGRLSRTMPGWEVISWTLVITLPVTLPATILLWPGPDRQVAASSWAALAYLAAMSMYLGFVAWNAGMALGGIARVSQVQLLQTFVTLAIAALILSERFDAETIGFALAVVAIVFLGRKFRIAPHGSK